MIRVLVCDDHPIVRQGLTAYLSTLEDIVVVGEAADGIHAVEAVGQLQPDVVLMDLAMPNMDGIEAIERLDTREVRVIALTSFATDDKVYPAIRAGAAGYMLKEAEPGELADAIRKVAAGESIMHPRIQERLMADLAAAEPRTHRTDLTTREREVIRLIAQGKTNRQIADELIVTIKTVKTHVSNILSKLGLEDRTQAAVYAVEHGLAEPGS